MPVAHRHSKIVVVSAILDALAISMSFLASYLLRFISGLIPASHTPPFNEYASALFVILPVYLFIFRSYKLYQSQRNIRRIEEIFIVIKAVTVSIVVLMAITFMYRDLSYSRIYLGLMWLVSAFFVSLFRYLFIQWQYQRRKAQKDVIRVLLIGANQNTRSIIQWAQNNPHYGRHIVGVLSHNPEDVGKHVEKMLIVGASDNYEKFIDQLGPEEVILIDHAFDREKVMDIMILCEDRLIDFKMGVDSLGVMAQSVDIEHISSVPLLGFKSLPLDDVTNRFIKRSFDVIVSFLGLILSAPIWILAVILIKLDDQGPLLYSQERVGRSGEVFKVLKFRTMKVNAEKDTGPVWAKPDDNRRTRVGDFFRRWNIDELPQLLNVLSGEMSLIGPRPERPHFVNQFREDIPRYMARHKVKSGLTGWAQVNGLRGNTSIHERIKYDLYYMENWSLLFDIEILFMTLFAFKNAY